MSWKSDKPYLITVLLTDRRNGRATLTDGPVRSLYCQRTKVCNREQRSKQQQIDDKYNVLTLNTFREVQYTLQNLFCQNTNTKQGLTPPEVTYHYGCVLREGSKLLFFCIRSNLNNWQQHSN
jgi:hypothetical protein